MTDKDTLCMYRFTQAEETLTDAQKMLHGNMSVRSVINRAYYAMFYAVLALFLHLDINLKTSKHTGAISVFDKECVAKGIIDKKFSKMFHKVFEIRQVGDYKEFMELSIEDASGAVRFAEEFVAAIKKLIQSCLKE